MSSRGRTGQGGLTVSKARTVVAIALVLAAVITGRTHADARSTGIARLSLITEPNRGYAPIYALLASPAHRLDFTIYELEDTTAEGILARDAARGVNVRVLLDQDYVGEANEAAFDYLRGHGVHVRWASNRVAITHEKSFVIDGHVAVIMTGNFTSRY